MGENLAVSREWCRDRKNGRQGLILCRHRRAQKNESTRYSAERVVVWATHKLSPFHCDRFCCLLVGHAHEILYQPPPPPLPHPTLKYVKWWTAGEWPRGKPNYGQKKYDTWFALLVFPGPHHSQSEDVPPHEKQPGLWTTAGVRKPYWLFSLLPFSCFIFLSSRVRTFVNYHVTVSPECVPMLHANG